MQTHYRISQINKPGSKADGIRLVMVDGGKYKDMIAVKMKRDNGADSGSWMVYKDCDDDFAEQVTSEHKISVRNGKGKVTQRWEKKKSHGDNHYLDAEVYAMAAADILGVRRLHMMDFEAGRKKLQSSEPPSQELRHTPEDSWIQTEEGWIGG